MPTPNPPSVDSEYVDSTDYDKLSKKLKDMVSVMDSLQTRNNASRKLRYAEIDVEVERAAGRIGADEVFVPQHIIDTNIRREQASYVQYLTQSSRAIILKDLDDPTANVSPLEVDLTNKLRYDDWQIPQFANIDGFQQNGYGIIETVFDPSKPGNISYDEVQLGDFGVPLDTKDVQQAEIVTRNFYFSKTNLLEMCKEGSPWEFDEAQVKCVTESEPTSRTDQVTVSSGDRSLYCIQKAMFRIKGIVHVAWCCESKCSDWIRKPRPLFIGRMKAVPVAVNPMAIKPMGVQSASQFTYEFGEETDYPYTVFPYLISENNTLDKLKGRAFLDQDTQVAVTSMMSSVCSAYRRASQMIFSKDTEDPNDNLELMGKNINFKNGAIINSKVKQFQLQWPDPSSLGAIQGLVTANQAETSKVNFAAQNRKDSRKTATEISASTQEAASLSTVQVVLFSTALKKMYTSSLAIIKSRVAAGLIVVSDTLKALYVRNYSIRPAGDVDVIERQQMIQMMMQAWPVIQNTPAASAFLSDLLMKMFPDSAPKYIQIFQAAEAKAASEAQQQQNQMLQMAQGVGKNIIELSKRPEMFSETGKIHALPIIENTAQQLEQFVSPEQV
jgi:hypothetical protein